MQLGWIDFSKTARNKILSVLSLPELQDTVDELGIGTIRDGFSNTFFPGSSTIQTRAKYFFIVPYALIDLERTLPKRQADFYNQLYDIERKCGEKLVNELQVSDGVIGVRSIKRGEWVQRKPSDIYWAGLREYKIFLGDTLSEYCDYLYAQEIEIKQQKDSSNVNDDKNNKLYKRSFWNIPTYTKDWFNKLDIDLSKKEAEFLKDMIISSNRDSMLSYILQKNMKEILKCKTFEEIKTFITLFPEKIQSDFHHAVSFSQFNYILRVLYNDIIYKHNNNEANNFLNNHKNNLNKFAKIDINEILVSANLYNNDVLLSDFLQDCKDAMLENNIEKLEALIVERERDIKGDNRARTIIGVEDKSQDDSAQIWFGGRELNYRFTDRNVKSILNDIFTGLEK
ncbi:DUF6361 family protein [Treponema bryantii]|uniref:DUF6361 family protein n=1 Tax=Treponema bryantii TaxID=163 RepID=UPI0003B4DA1E|nr:DUF6361 family protein [Treponema bryantii]